ncbi:MAG: nitrile hydratase accessory protein [Minwuia sp.]|nr:nitrile hydratase accessory protein [Minwuia sp.]
MTTAPMPDQLPALEALPDLPRDAGGPVFREPWEASAFAITLELHAAGHFTWNEWATALSQQIKAAQAAGDPDLGNTYYRHWLTALESLVTEKALATSEALDLRAQDWVRAYRNTPHGQPVKLKTG